MLKYDLHTHTHYSKCSNMKPEVLLKTAKNRGMNGIAVTDHFAIEGALKVKQLNRDRNFEVIVGEEISTNYGDVLAYYVNEKIKTTDFFEAVDEIKKQNGLVIIPHPFRTSLNQNHHFKLPFDKIKNMVNAIEIFNSRMLRQRDNDRAKETAIKFGLAGTAGSDAHFKFEVAAGYTSFYGNLRKALKEKKTRAHGRIRFGAFAGLLSFLRVRLC